MERERSLDAARGLAIVAMIVLNLSSVVLAGPTPLPLRFVGSLAAPIFVVLSGFAVSLTAGRHAFRYFLWRRAGWIVAVGIFIDIVAWRILPLLSMEVLYLIGLSIPVAYVASRLSSNQRAALVLAILFLTPALQKALGYTHYPTGFYLLSGEPTAVTDVQTGIVNHWLIDGWFPVFPWLALSIIGVELGVLFKRVATGAFDLALLVAGSGLVTVGGIAFLFAYPQTFPREASAELFYPPTVQFMGLSIGAALLFLLLFRAMARSRSKGLIRPLETMGRASLGIYFLHIFIATHLITYLSGGWWKLSLGLYFVAVVLTVLGMWYIARLYALLTDEGRRWVGKANRLLVVIVLAATAAAYFAGYLPGPDLPVTIFSGWWIPG